MSPTVTTPDTETVNDEVNLEVNAVMKPAFTPQQNEILVYDTQRRDIVQAPINQGDFGFSSAVAKGINYPSTPPSRGELRYKSQ